jgi:hypothetical protein
MATHLEVRSNGDGAGPVTREGSVQLKQGSAGSNCQLPCGFAKPRLVLSRKDVSPLPAPAAGGAALRLAAGDLPRDSR